MNKFLKLVALVATFLLQSTVATPVYADNYDSVVLTQPTGSLLGTSGSTTSVAVGTDRLSRTKHALFVLNDTAFTGTSLDVKIQGSADGVVFADLPNASFTTVTAAGAQAIKVDGPLGSFIRYKLTDGTVSVSAFTVTAFTLY